MLDIVMGENMGQNGLYGKHIKLPLPQRDLWFCLMDSVTEGDPEVWVGLLKPGKSKANEDKSAPL